MNQEQNVEAAKERLDEEWRRLWWTKELYESRRYRDYLIFVLTLSLGLMLGKVIELMHTH